MGKSIDKVGMRFGKLTVLELCNYKTRQNKKIYKCKCDCGTIKDIPSIQLREDGSKSCGCIKTESVFEIKTGDRFGLFTVLSEEPVKMDGGRRGYKCKCDCGTIKDVYYYNLVKGKTTNCGCVVNRQNVDFSNRFNRTEYMDLISQRFNLLTVERYLGKDIHNKHLYLCRCHCGNTIEIQGTYLRNMSVTCCGKCMSHAEARIYYMLLNTGIKFFKEYHVKINNELRALPFDFYIPHLNLVIEFDGEQHFKPVKKFGGIAKFEETVMLDNIKNQYCLDNRINLVRIPYWLQDQLEIIIPNIITHYTNLLYQFENQLLNKDEYYYMEDPVIIHNLPNK